MNTTHWIRLWMRVSLAIALIVGCATSAAAQYGGSRQANFSPVPDEFAGYWTWATGRFPCGDIKDSFGSPLTYGDGKLEGTGKTTGNLNLCQFPIAELEKVLNGRGRLWLKDFSADDVISPKWSCAITFTEALTEGLRHFIVRGDSVVLWHEHAQRGRQVFTDGRKHPPATDLFYWGHSIGWMEGKALVVETTNFTWDPDGYDDQTHMARSHASKWIERYSIKDADTMEVVITVDDPVFQKQALTFVGNLKRASAQQRAADRDSDAHKYECDPEADARDIYLSTNNPHADDNTAERIFGVK